MVQSHMLFRFSEVDSDDHELVGEKGARLGDMTTQGFPVPEGFIIATSAYFHFLKENGLRTKITHLLGTVNFTDPISVMQVASHIQTLIRQGELPTSLQKDIITAYRRLGGVLNDPSVVVRSSVIKETFYAMTGGSQESFINVKGEAAVLVSIKDIWASLFDPKSLFYRHKKEVDHFRLGIAVIIQKMIAAEASGTIVTRNPPGADKSALVMEAVLGLREMLSEGKITPDRYLIDKKTLEIKNKSLSEQNIQLERIHGELRTVSVDKKLQRKQKISDQDIRRLAELGRTIERHYYFPQKIHWAKTGAAYFILQTRDYAEEGSHPVPESKRVQPILTGQPASAGIISGSVKIITSKKELPSITPGDIVVTEEIDPKQYHAFKKAAGVITEATVPGHKFLHSFRLPLISGVKNATKFLKTGSIITLNGKTGEIHKGGYLSPMLREKRVALGHISVATKLYATITDLDSIENAASIYTDGVGILPAGLLIRKLGIHPKKMLRDGKGHLYTQMLAEELVKVCIAFAGRPVLYCASDLTSTEYRGLIGGKAYEPQEPNPFLGYRGATRFIHDPETFSLELKAIRHIRETMQTRNLWLMIPYVRTPSELFTVKKLLLSYGLSRSPNFKLWLMLQIPATVIRLEEFLKVGIDGVMIGSDDLTMLFSGTDRKNPEVNHALDEENEALLQAYRHIIKICHTHDIPAVYSGTASSPSSTLLEHLIKWGVSGVSLPVDAIENVRKTIYKYERRLVS